MKRDGSLPLQDLRHPPTVGMLQANTHQEDCHPCQAGTCQRSSLQSVGEKAPPIDPYTGEDPEVRIDDWLPALKRAVSWNDWSEMETLMQLVGHLRGRALQEVNLLSETERSKLEVAVGVLRSTGTSKQSDGSPRVSVLFTDVRVA